MKRDKWMLKDLSVKVDVKRSDGTITKIPKSMADDIRDCCTRITRGIMPVYVLAGIDVVKQLLEQARTEGLVSAKKGVEEAVIAGGIREDLECVYTMINIVYDDVIAAFELHATEQAKKTKQLMAKIKERQEKGEPREEHEEMEEFVFEPTMPSFGRREDMN